MTKKHIIIFAATLLLSLHCEVLSAHTDSTSQLFATLRARDSLLFGIGFNTCDTTVFNELVSGNFEFYHDKSGATLSKSAFIHSIANGLCKLPYKALRQLKTNSLLVYPMTDNGMLYGAIQMGEHSFYAIEKDGRKHLTSTAKFTHLWRLENSTWRLARCLSYDHMPPGE